MQMPKGDEIPVSKLGPGLASRDWCGNEIGLLVSGVGHSCQAKNALSPSYQNRRLNLQGG